VPNTVEAMAAHAFVFLDALGLKQCDVLGYSLGGMIAQQMALQQPSVLRRIILVATAPRGGEDIMHLEKQPLAQFFSDPMLSGASRLQKIFFASTPTSQSAGANFLARLGQRKNDRDPTSGPEVIKAQLVAFREWETFEGQRFEDLRSIHHPILIVNGVFDEMIPIRNSYWLAENLPNAMLMTYPDSGHGALFQFHEAFTWQADAFLRSDSSFAPSQRRRNSDHADTIV
jgi:pimeloyl-ACP methyl ester carboxylesterase